MTNTLKNDDSIEARYERAQTLSQGFLTKNIAFNTTLVPHWIGDEHFWYERDSSSGKEYRLVNTATGTNEIAFDHAALTKTLAGLTDKKVNAENLPIKRVDISLSPLQVSFSAFDKRWVFNCETAICQSLEDSLPRKWLISPDKKKAAFTRDYNLWVKDLATGEEKALTEDGERHYSYADFPCSIGYTQATTFFTLEALWSPDSTRLFTHQKDIRQVKTIPIVEHIPRDGSIRPRIMDADHRVPLPGDANVEEYRFLSIEIETGRMQEANYRRCPVYSHGFAFFNVLGMGWWSADSRRAYFIDMVRDCKIARIVEFDTHTGLTRIVFEENSSDSVHRLTCNSVNAPVNLPLPETNELIWYSERSGWAHLYLYDLNTGELKNPITRGDWLVRDILHYDADKRELFVQTAGRVAGCDPYYRDICRVQIDSGEITTLISTDHEYLVCSSSEKDQDIYGMMRALGRDMETAKSGVSPGYRYLVTTRSRVDEIPVSLLLDRDGRVIAEIETADVSGLPQGWQWPEPVKMLAADGKTDIYGVVFRPSDFSPDKVYPIIDTSNTYVNEITGPKGSFTNCRSLGGFYFLPAALAELGFIVVCIDGRGTPGRDKAFSHYGYGSVQSVNYQADRIAGIKQLAERYPYMDINRVGIGGVTATAGALLGLFTAPEFYKVGVSENQTGDGRLTSTIYTESWEELAEDNKVRESSFENFAANLQGKLLMFASLLDTSIPSATTFRVVDALQQANKNFDLMIMPKDGHEMNSYATRLIWDYFVKHLLDLEPPKEFKLTSGADHFVLSQQQD